MVGGRTGIKTINPSRLHGTKSGQGLAASPWAVPCDAPSCVLGVYVVQSSASTLAFGLASAAHRQQTALLAASLQ